jgi:hypothetical protein
MLVASALATLLLTSAGQQLPSPSASAFTTTKTTLESGDLGSWLAHERARPLVIGLAGVVGGAIVVGVGATGGFVHAADTAALNRAVDDYVEEPTRVAANEVLLLRTRLGPASTREAWSTGSLGAVVAGALTMVVGWSVVGVGAWQLSTAGAP